MAKNPNKKKHRLADAREAAKNKLVAEAAAQDRMFSLGDFDASRETHLLDQSTFQEAMNSERPKQERQNFLIRHHAIRYWKEMADQGEIIDPKMDPRMMFMESQLNAAISQPINPVDANLKVSKDALAFYRGISEKLRNGESVDAGIFDQYENIDNEELLESYQYFSLLPAIDNCLDQKNAPSGLAKQMYGMQKRLNKGEDVTFAEMANNYVSTHAKALTNHLKKPADAFFQGQFADPTGEKKQSHIQNLATDIAIGKLMNEPSAVGLSKELTSHGSQNFEFVALQAEDGSINIGFGNKQLRQHEMNAEVEDDKPVVPIDAEPKQSWLQRHWGKAAAIALFALGFAGNNVPQAITGKLGADKNNPNKTELKLPVREANNKNAVAFNSKPVKQNTPVTNNKVAGDAILPTTPEVPLPPDQVPAKRQAEANQSPTTPPQQNPENANEGPQQQTEPKPGSDVVRQEMRENMRQITVYDMGGFTASFAGAVVTPGTKININNKELNSQTVTLRNMNGPRA